mmetsp:Transcript_49017/g.116624  ORF Transcript_49017/g.116624 Transcript_49017/m.116624 type:complete len:272 (+) Transcript_49017:125-940(+)|eukprot:CAMPEP_0178444404 /NCGR_PEP_ID=MMETSP0689_2-20121128/39476_1 /TAXON_ID=160604 /ORGANISM="Amphidinium massartii, Strain CS-259" /LENGTH=271 /DNA_ID=CAMNT_0020068607 /DNA_START=125 /DNA_END=940 /DNA_ORIENTATION=-
MLHQTPVGQQADLTPPTAVGNDVGRMGDAEEEAGNRSYTAQGLSNPGNTGGLVGMLNPFWHFTPSTAAGEGQAAVSNAVRASDLRFDTVPGSQDWFGQQTKFDPDVQSTCFRSKLRPQEYDEELQEDIYLRADPGRDANEVGYPPVKNTFLHFDVLGSLGNGQIDDRDFQWCSAPTVVMQKSFHTKESQRLKEMQQRHAAGDCKPCAYFLYKADGCRQGDSCQFCHLCQRGEIKKRKKEKKRALRAAAAAQEGGSVDADSGEAEGAEAEFQ